MRRRALSWAKVRRDLTADRTARPEIREERLRLSGGLRCGVEISAWRGRSGRRYVVLRYPVAEAGRIETAEAVVIAVARGADGLARVLAMRQGDPRRPIGGWAPEDTAELHVYHLAETPAERAAIVEDLNGDEAIRAPEAKSVKA